jgi:hypothetical protein
VVLCLVALGLAACGSNRIPGSSNLKHALPTVNPALRGVPSLPDVARRSAETGGDFLLRQDGAGFAAELGSSRCTAAGAAAELTPQWSGTTPNPAGSAAYAVYRLTYDPQALPVTLSLAWNGAAPAAADCWIGLSDWTGQVWRWQQPAAGQLELASPGQFVDGTQHCLVALVVLGSTPCSLATIGFGTPPPLPTGDGYTLFTPLNDKQTYLIDMSGTVVKDWTSQYTAGATAELLENGHILRAANLGNPNFPQGGRAGRLEEYDWDGNLVWSYELNTATQCTHHDFTRLPNGNILLLVTNVVAPAEIVAAGRDPAMLDGGSFWVDSITEIQPTQPSGGNVVWEWRLLDHLVQDFDANQANYGDPAAHWERFDVNFPPNDFPGDWTHVNCVAYNPGLDQVMLTSVRFNEIWVIDHSTTTAEAAGHSGGRCGHGGDLLYRWGNPRAYRAGTADDEQFFGCHNGHWIADGLAGAGDILVFKNQTGHRSYSQVVQLTPPLNPDGSYSMTGGVFGPTAPTWVYEANPTTSFYSAIMGSAQRLPGGETLIDSAVSGQLFVVDAAGVIKWQYQNVYPTATVPAVFRALRYLPDYPGLASLP